MTSAASFERPGSNRLLSSLAPEYRERLLAHLRPVDLPLKRVLYEANVPISAVYFPLSGVVSLVSSMQQGAIVEIATVGNEGLIGVPVLLGATSAPISAFVQVPGEGLCMDADAFRAMLQQDGRLRDLLGRYTQGLFTQIAQSAACNRLHPVEERCARWLLMTHDRVAGDQFLLTQEFLGQMLGARRQAVSAVASILQRADYIRYVRGVITVVDRAGLEAAACECYRIIRDEYDRLLGV